MANKHPKTPRSRFIDDKEYARECARKGAAASIEARKRNKSMKEWALALGGLKADFKGPNGEDIAGDVAGVIVLKQIQRAISDRDTTAAAFISKLRGEDVQRIEFQDNEQTRHQVATELATLYGLPTTSAAPEEQHNDKEVSDGGQD